MMSTLEPAAQRCSRASRESYSRSVDVLAVETRNLTMIDLRYVKKLIEMIDGSSVDSIEISSEKGVKIRIAKSPTQRGTVQVAAPMTVPAMLQPGMVDTRTTPVAGVPAVGAEAPAAERAEK